MEFKFTIVAFAILFILSGCKKKDPKISETNPECDPEEIVINTDRVSSYTNTESFSPGESVPFMIHSLDSFCNIKIYRYGLQNELLLDSMIDTYPQNYNCRSYSFGCDWKETVKWNIPISARSGMYGAEVATMTGEKSYTMFVVRGDGSAPIAVLASTNTWQAYNDWGGHSFYRYNLNDDIPNSQMVSFHRPNNAAYPYGNRGHLANAELYLLRWLELNSYDYELYSDRDMHNGLIGKPDHNVLILNVHNEYWTDEMYNNLEGFLNSGGNLMSLAANSVYWRVTYMQGDRIEVQKNGAWHFFSYGYGGYWRELGRPEAAVLGVAYDRRGYDTYYPYEVKNSNHWIFSGTGLSNGDIFGDKCLNGGGASGHETDKMTIETPPNAVFLAKGTNPETGGATISYYSHPGGGAVFATGSITYTGSLPVDSAISRITANVLNSFQ